MISKVETHAGTLELLPNEIHSAFSLFYVYSMSLEVVFISKPKIALAQIRSSRAGESIST